MPEDMLLDLQAIREQRGQAGFRAADDETYPWLILGPIELARYTELQQELIDIAEESEENNLTIDQAERQVVTMRKLLAFVVPTLPKEQQDALSDTEVDLVLRFFEKCRLEEQSDQMEDIATQMERQQARSQKVADQAQKQADTTESIKDSGERTQSASSGIRDLNRKIRRRTTGQ